MWLGQVVPEFTHDNEKRTKVVRAGPLNFEATFAPTANPTEHRRPGEGRQTDPEQVEPGSALRGGVQSGS